MNTESFSWARRGPKGGREQGKTGDVSIFSGLYSPGKERADGSKGLGNTQLHLRRPKNEGQKPDFP